MSFPSKGTEAPGSYVSPTLPLLKRATIATPTVSQYSPDRLNPRRLVAVLSNEDHAPAMSKSIKESLSSIPDSTCSFLPFNEVWVGVVLHRIDLQRTTQSLA